VTPKKTPVKEETLDTPHFENEDTDEIQATMPEKRFSPLEVRGNEKEQRSYSPQLF
jgi:hypothetical protein